MSDRPPPAVATIWYDDGWQHIEVTIAHPGRAVERIAFERWQDATEFLERHDFRPQQHDRTRWVRAVPPDNVVCLDDWRR